MESRKHEKTKKKFELTGHVSGGFLMAVAIPEWLARHGAGLQQGPNGSGWFVLFGNHPQYRLRPFPAKGTFACEIMQTVNNRFLECKALYSSPDEAIQGGLEDLRIILGW